MSDESSSLGLASFGPIGQELRELGYLEGRNIVFENRYANGRIAVLPGLVAELVRLKVDVIVLLARPGRPKTPLERSPSSLCASLIPLHWGLWQASRGRAGT